MPPVFGHPTGGAEMLKKQRGHQQAELACLCRGARTRPPLRDGVFDGRMIGRLRMADIHTYSP